tara:strand:+ start:17048 stop:19822 length:2775 start_codon:yes stop_codon:yes gene_type:complete
MSEEESAKEIKIDYRIVSTITTNVSKFLKQKKVIYSIVLILLLLIIIIGVSIRVQNLPLLIDSTTGEYIPTALDPFYFLRLAETIIEQGSLPEFDSMRYIPANLGFTKEMGVPAIVLLYKVSNAFGDYSIQFIDVIFPVVFFALGLILFFFLILVLTNSKSTALLSSIFLAIIPAYLHRTTAGFSDHEAIGMFAFFSVMIIYTLGLKFLENLDGKEIIKKDLIKLILFGVATGFLTVFTIFSWSGIAVFIFMIFPLSFFMLWLTKTKHHENLNKKYIFSFLIFYITWFFSSILFSLFFGLSFSSIIDKFFLSTSSLINGGILLFLIVDYFLILNRKILKEREKYRILFSFLISFVLGFILLALLKGNIFSLIPDIINRFLHPLGAGRTGLTVAENAQPFLNQWIGQIGKIFFWLFYFGTFLIGVEISKGIKKNKDKILFSLIWLIMISGILFSRISGDSLFNGTNTISQLVYFGGLILFFGYFLWIYFKDGIKIKPEIAIIASWAIFMLIGGRGAIRFFFLITPFTIFMASFFVIKIFDHAKKSKDDFFKMILFIIFIISALSIIVSGIGNPFNENSSGFYQISNQQAKQTGPSANFQWQHAMSWVRENTPKDSIFVHWWDYGYWVQYLGERPTVTDGGHGVGYWDHLIGRYLLTTPKPESALSFMKTQNVSYLLIDPTDLGKYPAYSRIGSDEEGNDRFSQIPVMIMDSSQTQQTGNKTIRVYHGGVAVDEDIIYGSLNETQVFLPSGKAIAAGAILEYSNEENLMTFNQPQEIFIYNQEQINIPIRYIYHNNKLIDFGSGLDAVIRVIPLISQSNQQVNIDPLGSVIYLSPKVSKGLFAQLYLLDDAFKNYGTVSLVHSELDPIVSNLNSQGANLNDFVYFNGFRGPIKIWEVNYPSNILEKEEFLEISGEFAELDDLVFVR